MTLKRRQITFSLSDKTNILFNKLKIEESATKLLVKVNMGKFTIINNKMKSVTYLTSQTCFIAPLF